MKNEKIPCPLRMLLSFCAAVLLAAGVLSALPLEGEEEIFDNVVRLHVLANSDTEEDQALKLSVRDDILLYLAEGETPQNAEEAEELYRSELDEIRELAEEKVRDAGYDYPVRVTLTEEPYPVRTYDSYTFPAGTYRSLRVMIGNAEGHNWWCVLFPPLCLSLAAEEQALPAGNLSVSPDGDEVLMSAGFTPYEVGLLSGTQSSRIKVKFKIVEWLRELFR